MYNVAMTENKMRGNIALLVAALVWGSGFIAQKLGMSYMDPFTFNAGRQLLACPVLLPYAIYVSRSKAADNAKSRASGAGRSISERRHDLLIASLVCGFFLSAGTNLQQIGLVTVSAGKSGFISALYIVVVPLIGLLFGNRTTIKIWLCILMSIVGFALLSLRGGLGGATTGDWLTLISAIVFACQMVSVNHFVTRNNAIVLSVAQMLISGVLSLIMALIFEHPTIATFMYGIRPVLFSALIPTAVGYTLQVVGQKYTDPAISALILSMESVFAAVMGAIFLNEHMVLRETIGCAVIFMAIIISQLPDRRPDEPPA